MRLGARIAGSPLPSGTYRIVARAGDRIVARRRFVVSREKPTQRELLARLRQDVCTTTTASSNDLGTAFFSATPAAARNAAAPSTSSSRSRQAGSNGSAAHEAAGGSVARPRGPQPHGGGVLGTIFTKPVAGTPAWLRPILIAFLAAAIMLLGLAALPQAAIPGARVTAVVAHRRLELALLGICVVAAVAIAAALS